MYNKIPIYTQALRDGAHIPEYQHAHDAGADLRSRVSVQIEPGARCVIPTGLAIALHENQVGYICSRSGLSANSGVIVLNAPGVLDYGYLGEIKVILLNTDKYTPYHVRRGDRIAQLVVQNKVHAEFIPVLSIPTSASRGSSGFGGTGRK